MKKMVFEMDVCGACRTCEMACSYHHSGEFNPDISSIRIRQKDGEQGYEVQLLEKDEGPSRACDGCRGLDVPVCVQFCSEGDVLTKILHKFLKEVGD